MGIFDFLKKKTPLVEPIQAPPVSAPPVASSPATPTPPANPGVSQIEREHFLLHAPFQWVAVPGDNPLEFDFRNQTLKEQLMVTVLIAREPFTGPTRRSVAEDLAKKRLSALASISNGRAVHSTPQLQSGSDQVEVRCFGRDEAQQVRIAFVIRVAAAKVVTVQLTRYFLNEVGLPFEAYSGAIFDFLKIKNPGSSAAT